MIAGYRQSEFQRDLLRLIATIDRSAADFYVTSPITLDCSEDREAFAKMVGEKARLAFIRRYERGEFVTASRVQGAARAYIRAQIRRRFQELDRDAVAAVETFLRDWRGEEYLLPGQRRKAPDDERFGVEIILPVNGIRLSLDSVNLAGL